MANMQPPPPPSPKADTANQSRAETWSRKPLLIDKPWPVRQKAFAACGSGAPRGSFIASFSEVTVQCNIAEAYVVPGLVLGIDSGPSCKGAESAPREGLRERYYRQNDAGAVWEVQSR